LKDGEKQQYPDLKQIMIAWDAIAIVVNPSVTVSGLSKDQVRDIYMGKITNWKQVGGADKAITIVSREEGSGTRDGFQSLVMVNDANGKANPIAASAILQSSNGAVRTTVSTTPDAIGYIGFGYVDKSVKALVFDGVELTAANAASKQYPLVRPLNMLVKGTPKPAVQAWLDWILSTDGQQVAVKEGYVAVK
jgi:phosphate transport system substrate-binding protein